MDRLRSMLPRELQGTDPKMVTHGFCLEIIRTPALDLERLIFLANYLTDVNWKQVCEERSCEQICGWPLCAKSTSWTASKPAIVMRPNAHNGVQLLDRTELFWYCGQTHMELSKQLEASLNEEPWWLQASRTRPLDLDWLHIVVELYEGDSTHVDYSSAAASAVSELSKGIHDLEDFTIKEHVEDSEMLHQLSSTTIQPPSAPNYQPHMLAMNIKSFSPFESSQESSELAPSRAETPSNGMAMDVDNESQDSFSDDDDEVVTEFFDSSFGKKPIQLHLSPNLQVMNTMLHWVTWKTQKFASLSDYQPHLNSAMIYVPAQYDDAMDTTETEEDQSGRFLPAVDGVDVQQSRRQAVINFITTRFASIRSYIPEIEGFGVKKTLDALIGTFDLTAPMEPLKASQWSTILVALLYAISPKHPGLAQLLEANRTLLEQQCNVDLGLVKELQGMFVHHG